MFSDHGGSRFGHMVTQMLVIGGDHAGFQLKQQIVEHLKKKGYGVKDVGTHDEQSTDYPEQAHEVAKAIHEGEATLGILICGSGNGVNMTANKHAGVRAALAWNEEVARLARSHNNANVLSLPARFIHANEAERIVDAFLDARFEGGRHERRVKKIEQE